LPEGRNLPWKVAKAFKKCVFNRITKAALRGKLKRFNDTPDVSKFIARYKTCCTRHSTKWLWGTALFWRIYNNPKTWERLEKAGAVPEGCAPRWGRVEATLLALYTERKNEPKLKLRSGLYYPVTARKVSNNQGKTWRTLPAPGTPRREATRDVAGLKAMWRALPTKELNAWGVNKSRKAFALAYDRFRERMDDAVSGLTGDYMVKCVLDCVCGVGQAPTRYISRWPSKCPGYSEVLRDLYPEIASKHHEVCLMHFFHKFTSSSPRFHGWSVPEVFAQLCWTKRRISGALVDS